MNVLKEEFAACRHKTLVNNAFLRRCQQETGERAEEERTKGLKRVDFLALTEGGGTRWVGLRSTGMGPDIWELVVVQAT